LCELSDAVLLVARNVQKNKNKKENKKKVKRWLHFQISKIKTKDLSLLCFSAVLRHGCFHMEE
jgi:hypothetical protein